MTSIVYLAHHHSSIMWHCGVFGALPFLAPLACTTQALDHRVVVYYQTTHYNSSATSDVSLLPLVKDQAHVAATHVLISAIHIVDEDGGIRLNDHAPDNEIFDHVWSDAAHLQAAGVTVMAMVGGAAPGSWDRLDGDDAQFEHYYKPLHDFIGNYNIEGLDLDVEQSMSLDGIIRLIDRLKKDFGDDFVISLAPVGSALTKGGGNLSGFDYFELEAQRGDKIAFYNAQFYFGWGDPSSAADYEDIIDDGFRADKVVMGLLTNPANGNGYVSLDKQAPVLEELVSENPTFGGVAGWEYFNSLPGGDKAPEEWATWMGEHITPTQLDASGHPQAREISPIESVHRAMRKSYRQVRGFGKRMYRNYIA
ncbi:glycoside hydrolase superfamily [Microdochium trichocladiopsis]|uniref:Glycoside hydrolase superfamily n=1 Tax=Microdochium trichocladiopsis TaxID=1682393 RepID=A0A9P9BUX4_9PEZI|nr:glycoside hydrolase superfamily [Microdochium trichocladiopsis]KAH7038081.1 glycoside hydrolase superfamily [Microdochium trichocladiopsis]